MNNQMDTRTSIVNPNNMFFDGVMQDLWDLSIIGQIHDMEFGVLASTFCKTKKEYDEIAQVTETGTGQRKYSLTFTKRTQNTHRRLSTSSPLHYRTLQSSRGVDGGAKQRFRCHGRAIGEVILHR